MRQLFLAILILLANPLISQQSISIQPAPDIVLTPQEIASHCATTRVNNLLNGVQSYSNRGPNWNVYDGYGGGCLQDCSIDPLNTNGAGELVDCSGIANGIATYRVPVVFTIVRSCGSNNVPGYGSGSLSDAELLSDFIDEQIEDLNIFHAAQNLPIQLYKHQNHTLTGPSGVILADASTRIITEIDLCDFGFSSGPGTDNAIADNIDVPDVLNIYVASTVGGFGSCLAYAFLPTGPGAPDRLVMQVNCLLSGQPNEPCTNPEVAAVFIHEVGHVFGLFHTHDSSGGALYEDPDGSNCCNAGDRICDTDADPDFSGGESPAGCAPSRIGFTCDFNMNGCSHPVSGNLYATPPNTVGNIMSYNNLSGCRTNYSDCQKAKMVDALLCARAHLCSNEPSQFFADLAVNGTNSPYKEICIGDTIPTFQAKTSGLNWYPTETGGTAISLLSSNFTPTAGTGAGQLNVNTPGTYIWYVEDNNSVAECRVAVSITVLSGPLNEAVNGSTSYTACSEILSFTADAAAVGTNEVMGWWFTQNPISFANQSELDAALSGVELSLPINTNPNHLIVADDGVSDLTLQATDYDCTGEGIFYATPVISKNIPSVPDVNLNYGPLASSGITFNGAAAGFHCTGNISGAPIPPPNPPTFTLTVNITSCNVSGNNLTIWLSEDGSLGNFGFVPYSVSSGLACSGSYIFTEADVSPGYDPTNGFCLILNRTGVPISVSFTTSLTITYPGEPAVSFPTLDYNTCFMGSSLPVDCICETCVESNFLTPPAGLHSVIGATTFNLLWDPYPNSTKCQIQGNKTSAPIGTNGSFYRPQQGEASEPPTQFGVVNNTATLPGGGNLIPGETYRWKVRCGCLGPPIAVSPWSAWDTFVNPNGFVDPGILKILNASSELFVFPNPSDGSFNLVADEDNYNLFVYDLTGRLVMQDQFRGTTFNLDLRDAEIGIYVLRLQSLDGILTKRIVIER